MRGTDDDDQAEEGEPSSERSFELSKSISLQALSPIALDDIRREGRCTADLTEEIFDRDHPGHYFRQIESVSVSIPTIAGPHTDVDCTLTLIRSSIRISSRLLGGPNGYGRRMKGKAEVRDLRFRDNDVPVTGAGASDRWLPFEAG